MKKKRRVLLPKTKIGEFLAIGLFLASADVLASLCFQNQGMD